MHENRIFIYFIYLFIYLFILFILFIFIYLFFGVAEWHVCGPEACIVVSPLHTGCTLGDDTVIMMAVKICVK